jgi:hypothetical protein
MPVASELLATATTEPAGTAWATILDHVWREFSASLPAAAADAEVVKRDRDLTELDNIISGSAWDLWNDFDTAVPKASEAIVNFWTQTQGGKAVLILDGLSLREVPWLLQQARERGLDLHNAEIRGAELPAETTPFANSLGFGQRSSLDNNGSGAAHKLKGAFTVSCNLPWQECVDQLGSHEAVVFWHHWPDERLHELAVPGVGLHKLAKETHAGLSSDDFWQFVQRLCTGRRLLITSDHGYAATGMFPDLTDKDQVNYMRTLFKSGRSSSDQVDDGAWVPPIDLLISTNHGAHRYVLGRRKWKSAAGYPTLQHGGLSLLEVLVPLVILSK